MMALRCARTKKSAALAWETRAVCSSSLTAMSAPFSLNPKPSAQTRTDPLAVHSMASDPDVMSSTGPLARPGWTCFLSTCASASCCTSQMAAIIPSQHSSCHAPSLSFEPPFSMLLHPSSNSRSPTTTQGPPSWGRANPCPGLSRGSVPSPAPSCFTIQTVTSLSDISLSVLFPSPFSHFPSHSRYPLLSLRSLDDRAPATRLDTCGPRHPKLSQHVPQRRASKAAPTINCTVPDTSV